MILFQLVRVPVLLLLFFFPNNRSFPSQIPGLLDSIKSFDKCSKGVGYALLLTVPTLYVTSAVLFAFLGIVIHKSRQPENKSGYATFENKEQNEGTIDS